MLVHFKSNIYNNSNEQKEATGVSFTFTTAQHKDCTVTESQRIPFFVLLFFFDYGAFIFIK